MKNLEDLEKKINSELTTKINKTEIKHNQIYLETDKDDFIDVCLFIKTNIIINGIKNFFMTTNLFFLQLHHSNFQLCLLSHH